MRVLERGPVAGPAPGRPPGRWRARHPDRSCPPGGSARAPGGTAAGGTSGHRQTGRRRGPGPRRRHRSRCPRGRPPAPASSERTQASSAACPAGSLGDGPLVERHPHIVDEAAGEAALVGVDADGGHGRALPSRYDGHGPDGQMCVESGSRSYEATSGPLGPRRHGHLSSRPRDGCPGAFGGEPHVIEGDPRRYEEPRPVSRTTRSIKGNGRNHADHDSLYGDALRHLSKPRSDSSLPYLLHVPVDGKGRS